MLDREGHFFHEGKLVEHPRLAAAMATWIHRHPDDGRFILNNGYDWSYFSVEDAPFFVRAVTTEGDEVWLQLSDGTRERWDPASSRVGEDGTLYARVKAGERDGPFEARFTNHAATALGPLLEEVGGEPAVRVGGKLVTIKAREAHFPLRGAARGA